MSPGPPGKSRVLMVFAHADDETLLAGALIAKLVSVGHEVKVLCLAPGGGERIQRMRNACEVLGVAAVETFRYAEGAMWPDELETHRVRLPETRLYEIVDHHQTLAPVLATAPTADLAGRIGGRISEYRPDLVITHSRYGDYGHADHAATYLAVVRAFEASAGMRARLYALAWPSFLVSLNSRLMKIGGRDISRMGPDGRFDLPLAIRSHSASDAGVTLEVADMLRLRRVASRWYAPEISKGPLVLRLLERLPIRLQQTVLGRARLTLVRAPAGFTPGASRDVRASADDSFSDEYL
ncbi:MAG: PIG-L family deacetylase [Chloroflexi bacterium]|nr:PIG-L family deacetylase [Chloroflexota bacterium]